MIGLLFRFYGWLKHLLVHVEREEDLAGEWPHTVQELPEPRFKVFEDGLVGEDITNLDQGNVDELRRIYGPKGIIPDEKLRQWAAEVQQKRAEAQALADRIRELEAQPTQPLVDDGYRPASGPGAGTSPKTGIVLPPKITDITTREWCDLRLEQAYGLAYTLPSILGSDAQGNRAVGFSMRRLNELRLRAEQRDPSLSAYDIAILRSRGLV